ncbi:MAG: carbohydrate kinase family protein [candidate division NC10 bacterium]|nr:carbohydrate kinase family protein [candidate division NC10 bacterium]
MRSLDVVAVGELNPDLILDGVAGLPRLGQEILADRATFTLGSSTALCAANLAALGLRVGIVGKVGGDLFGDFVLQSLRDRGIDASRVVRDPAVRTGVTVSLAYPQDRAMVTFPGAMASLRGEEVDLAYLSGARHLHVSSFFLQQALQPGCAALFRAAKERGLTTSLDPGWDPAERWDAGLAGLYPWLDILFVNQVEAAALGGKAEWREGAATLGGQVSTVVVKRGMDGAGAMYHGTWHEHPGFPVEAVDPTGAGDAFNAGFLFGRLSGLQPRLCLRWGNACGALTAGHRGGSGAFSNRADVEGLIRSQASP